jgi:hypothetical protein
MSARRGLVGALVAVGALVVVAACSGGLKVEEGNAFPCDYSRAEEVRDTACAPGWRCGIDGRCHEDVPEVEGASTRPDYQDPTRLYPRQLTGEARFVAVDPRAGRMLVGYENDAVFLTNGIFANPVQAPVLSQAAFVGNRVALHTVSGGLEGPRREALSLGTLEPGAGALAVSPVQPTVDDPRALRALTQADGGTSLLVLRAGGRAGEVNVESGQYTDFPGGFTALADGGVCVGGVLPPGCPADVSLLPILDARPVPANMLAPPRRGEPEVAGVSPVVVTRDFFFWRTPPGGLGGNTWRVLNLDDPISSDAPAALGPWLLRHNEGATVWALRRLVREPPPSTATREVLSTWTLQRSPQGPSLERAWDDCSPCGAGRLVTFTPVSDGALGVEALCESSTGTRTLLRVVGASVTSPLEACLRQPLESPVDLTELASSGEGRGRLKPFAVDESLGAGLAVGGEHGQLWAGGTLSTLRPLFLDRAPREVAPLRDSFLALTPDFFALSFPEVGPGELEGLTVVDPSQVDGGVPVQQGRPAALVRGVPGWLLLDTGQLVRISPTERALGTAYGPQLLAPDGTQATGPFLGQGVPGRTPDAGPSLVLTASDQLYVLDSARLEAEPGAQPGLLPRLTPDPGFPIRSLARDPSAGLPGASGPRVRGWLSTGRSLFEYQQSQEGQWSLVPLPLGEAEPVEVWSREGDGGSYGRVGLRDGQVLRLPSGLPMTQPLPVGDFAVDYAALGDWPVALGEKAVYGTTPDARSSSGLLEWKSLSLPPGIGNPEEALKGARIEVVPESGGPALLLFTRTGAVHRLGRLR